MTNGPTNIAVSENTSRDSPPLTLTRDPASPARFLIDGGSPRFTPVSSETAKAMPMSPAAPFHGHAP